MLLSYRDPQFWQRFQSEHWLPRVPTVLRQPFTESLFSEAALLSALQSYEARLRGGDERCGCLVSIGKKEKAPRRLLGQLFRDESPSLERLEQNCTRVFKKETFGLMITHFQAVHPEIWSPITAFLQDARGYIDFPVPRAFLDLFYGNYSSQFTGLHKDTQEIFAFVVRGKKRMLLWPFDYFLPKVEGLTPAAKYFHMRLAVDHRTYRQDALVLDAEPGDVFYWPSDRWHVAEAEPGRFSAMISLGLFRPEFAPPKPSRDQAGFRERLLSGPTPTLPSQDMTTVMAETGGARQLRWVTGFGFELGGPISDTPPGRTPASVTVVKKKHCLVLWKDDSAGRRILVSANGHSITLPHSDALTGLLERISRGESVALSRRPPQARGAGPQVLETNWNKRSELTTRKRSSRRDAVASLVDWLLRVHAVEPSVGLTKPFHDL